LQVSLPDSVLARIRSVEVPIEADVRECLAELAQRPRLGTPIKDGDFEGLMAYEFRVNRIPISRVFGLLYRVDREAGTLEVQDFGVFVGEPSRLAPPSFEIKD
jgi:hypothetical protein